MFRKVIGVLLLILGLSGLVFSVAGVYIGRQAIDDLGSSIDRALSRTAVSLDTAADTLVIAKSTLDKVNVGLDTVGVTADNVAQTLLDTQPMLDSVSTVVATNIPDSLEAIQESLPGVAAAAGTIDDTLRKLSEFEVSREVFGIPIAFDLGIDYQPVVSLDESVLQIGQSLDGMPDSLRAIQSDMDVANENLEALSSNINTIASDLEALGDNIQQIDPLFDEYIELIGDIQQSVIQTQAELATQLEMAKLILTLLFVWIGVNQLIPIYLSVDIFTRKSRDNDADFGSSDNPATHEPEDGSKDKEAVGSSLIEEDPSQQEDD